MRSVFGIWILLTLATLGLAGESEAKAPAWGDARMGLQLSFEINASPPPRVRSRFYATVRIRNSGKAAVPLPKVDSAFGWLMVSQSQRTDGSQIQTKLYFSKRLSPGIYISDWPKALKPGEVLTLKAVPISRLAMHPYLRGMKFREAYRNREPIKAIIAGPLGKVLSPGEVSVRFCLYLAPDGREVQLKSNVVTTTVLPPRFKQLDAAGQKAFLSDLLGKFDTSAWAGQDAHAIAVEIGPALTPHLAKAAREKKRPRYSRAWLVTALCDIRDPAAIPTLIELMQDPIVDVFIAYHGPKLKSPKLDAAILARARKVKSASLVGYALLGGMAHRGVVSRELLRLGLDHPTPKVRAAAADALGKMAGSVNLKSLVDLLKDKDINVAASAARVLGCMKNTAPKILIALIDVLDRNDDHLRRRATEALSTLTKVTPPKLYNPLSSKQEKKRVLTFWEDYGKTLKSKTPKPQ